MILKLNISLSCALLLLLVNNGIAQPNAKYIGPYEVANYSGKANFEYKYIEGDTVLNGPFKMSSSNLSKLLNSVDNHFDIQGSFQNGMATGLWQFNFDKYQLADKEDIIISNHQYQVKVNGQHHEVSGNFLQGKPNGKWTQHIQQISSSQPEKTLFKSVTDFNSGIPQKSFRIENGQMILAGRFLRDGLAHDAWELFSLSETEATERWQFTDGWLKQIEWKKSDAITLVSVYDKIPESNKAINLDSRYLQILALNHLLTKPDSISWSSNMSNLLDENARHYKTIDAVLSDLGNDSFMFEFKVKAYYHALTDSELNRLKYINTSYKEAKEVVNRILNSTQINLLKLSDEEVLYLTTVMEKIGEVHLGLIHSVSQYNNDDILSHVPCEMLLSKLWGSGGSYTDITVDYEMEGALVSNTYIGSTASAYNFNEGGIEDVYQLTKYVLETVQEIEKDIINKLTREQLEQELIVLEEELIEEVTQLNALSDSLASTVIGEPKTAIAIIKSVTKNELARYSKLEDLSAKPSKARNLISCVSDMDSLSLNLGKVSKRNQELNKLYTDRVWNPFTSTLMDEIVKKHILDAYYDILLPHFFNDLNENLACENVSYKILMLEGLYQRMTELRQEDTDRLERKLKREKNPQTIMELFELSNVVKSADNEE